MAQRARAFAMHAIRQTEADAAHYGRMRYSLWTGDPGFAIYLWDCINGYARAFRRSTCSSRLIFRDSSAAARLSDLPRTADASDRRRSSARERHTFDIAREGYVNLFPAHHRQSRSPGDDERMVAARRRFLDAGHFAPLRVNSPRRWPSHANATHHECRRRSRLRRRLFHGRGGLGGRAHVYGIDVSKTAIRAAAKRYPSTTFAVASSTAIAARDASFDAATAILAPIDADVVRVLANDGVLVRVSLPARTICTHCALWRIRNCGHTGALPTELPGFDHAERASAPDSRSTPTGMARADLIAMTPMLHRTREDQRLRALTTGTLDHRSRLLD